MKIKYFEDTDTALLEFSERQVFETKEINENIYLDLDESPATPEYPKLEV